MNDAEKALKEAEQLAEKKGRTAEENKRLADLLNRSRTDLEFTEALGYGTKRDFKVLYDQVSEIEKKTEGGKFGTGFFARVKSSIGDLRRSNQTAETKQPSASAQASNK